MELQGIPSAPSRGLVDSAVLDFLLMELVAEGVSATSLSRTTPGAERDAASNLESLPLEHCQSLERAWSVPPSKESSLASKQAETLTLQRVEEAGFYVGERLARTDALHIPFERGSITELDALKVVCRDVWRSVFGKQVDSLKTNHHGVYVIFDASFRWLRYVHEMPDSIGTPSWYCTFPAGLIRGVLMQLGHPCTVHGVCEPAPPSVVFTVRMASASAPESTSAVNEPSPPAS
jgi:hypothetical protein